MSDGAAGISIPSPRGLADMKIRRGAVGGRGVGEGVFGLRVEGARRLYLGHPGRHPLDQ